MLLARLALRADLSPYGGQGSFVAGQAGEPWAGRFSLFLSNEGLSGYWFRLYYYEGTETEAEQPAA